MDAIQTYLNNVFAALPQTERALALKKEMLAGMEEKYYALKQEGKSEHEAVGGVIVNFGSIDEIAAELGDAEQPVTGRDPAERIPTKRDPAGRTPTDRDPVESPAERDPAGRIMATRNLAERDPAGREVERENMLCVSGDEAHTYLDQTKKSGLWVGVGVWLVLAGVSTMIMIDGSVRVGEAFENAGIFALMLALAPAVAIFIANGISMNKYEPYSKKKIELDVRTRLEIEQQSAGFARRFAIQLSAGVAVILFAVGAFIFAVDLVAPENENVPIALLLLCIGFGVFLMIPVGMVKSAFDVLLGKGDYADKAKNSKAGQVIGAIAAVYWPVVTGIFLLWSFLGDAWEISWIIWPVAGVVFGGVAGGIGAWYSFKAK